MKLWMLLLLGLLVAFAAAEDNWPQRHPAPSSKRPKGPKAEDLLKDKVQNIAKLQAAVADAVKPGQAPQTTEAQKPAPAAHVAHKMEAHKQAPAAHVTHKTDAHFPAPANPTAYNTRAHKPAPAVPAWPHKAAQAAPVTHKTVAHQSAPAPHKADAPKPAPVATVAHTTVAHQSAPAPHKAEAPKTAPVATVAHKTVSHPSAPAATVAHTSEVHKAEARKPPAAHATRKSEPHKADAPPVATVAHTTGAAGPAHKAEAPKPAQVATVAHKTVSHPSAPAATVDHTSEVHKAEARKPSAAHTTKKSEPHKADAPKPAPAVHVQPKAAPAKVKAAPTKVATGAAAAAPTAKAAATAPHRLPVAAAHAAATHQVKETKKTSQTPDVKAAMEKIKAKEAEKAAAKNGHPQVFTLDAANGTTASSPRKPLKIEKISGTPTLHFLGTPDECTCEFKSECTCKASLAFMDCISAACASGKCDCKADQYMTSCQGMGEICPDLDFQCTASKAVCSVETAAVEDLDHLQAEPIQEETVEMILADLSDLKEKKCQYEKAKRDGWLNADNRLKELKPLIEKRMQDLTAHGHPLPDMHCYHHFEEWTSPNATLEGHSGAIHHGACAAAIVTLLAAA